MYTRQLLLKWAMTNSRSWQGFYLILAKLQEFKVKQFFFRGGIPFQVTYQSHCLPLKCEIWILICENLAESRSRLITVTNFNNSRDNQYICKNETHSIRTGCPLNTQSTVMWYIKLWEFNIFRSNEAHAIMRKFFIHSCKGLAFQW